MDALFKNIKIVALGHPLDGKKTNLYLKNGTIADVNAPENGSYGQIFEAERWSVSVGWFDLRAGMNEPGYEHKDTLAALAQAALKGGFTDLAVLPNTFPVIQRSNDIANVLAASQRLPVRLHPIGAASADAKGEEMSELYDMKLAGAAAFSDGHHPIQNTGLLKKLLIYLKQFDGLLMNVASDRHLEAGGLMHEGIASTMLGMKGVPAAAETLAIMAHLETLRYAGGKIHFSTVSAKRSLDLIREAKAEGLAVSCDVSAGHLVFTDTDLNTFDAHLKTFPPFRGAEDRAALWAGLADGTIDAIVSDHRPQDIESKNLEFDLADGGLLGLESFFGALGIGNVLPIGLLLEKFTSAPRRILGLPQPKIETGAEACLTFFNENEEWLFTEKDIVSKSKNSPFVGMKLHGKVLGTANKGLLKM